MQEMHRLRPAFSWKVPDAQLVHAEEPLDAMNWPEAHPEHVEADADDAYVPARQVEQTLAPAAAYWPAAQDPVTAIRPVEPQ